MQSTWQCFAISPIITAMRSAIVPDTPVSISSKIIVGRFLWRAISPFRASITRAISPPEAISLTGCIGTFLLAEKRNTGVSMPQAAGTSRGWREK